MGLAGTSDCELRCKGIEKLLEVRRINYRQEIYKLPRTHHAFPVNELTYLGNVIRPFSSRFVVVLAATDETQCHAHAYG